MNKDNKGIIGIDTVAESTDTLYEKDAQVTQTEIGTQTAEAEQNESIVNHDEDALIDNETTFFGLLEILRKKPEAIAAEHEEVKIKEEEEKEARLKAAISEDHDCSATQTPDKLGKDIFGKAGRRPGPMQLWNRYHRIALKDIGNDGHCEVYENGYAVYDNGDRRAVVWVPDCGSATYYFTPLRDSEKEHIKQKDQIGENVFGSLPWYHAVVIAGEDSIERNLVRSKSAGTASASDASEGNVQPDYRWQCGGYIETPEEAYIRKETERERLSVLTSKQREVYKLYYHCGFNEIEIGKILGISRSSVRDRLECIWEKLGKNIEKYF